MVRINSIPNLQPFSEGLLHLEIKKMTEISFCSQNTVGKFSSLQRKKRLHRLWKKKHKFKNLIKARTYGRTSKLRTLPAGRMESWREMAQVLHTLEVLIRINQDFTHQISEHKDHPLKMYPSIPQSKRSESNLFQKVKKLTDEFFPSAHEEKLEKLKE